MMLKKFVLLISILSSVAFAQDGNVNISGYAFNTTFSDNSFHNNRNVVAVNLDADYDNFAFRTQIAGLDATNLVRRAVIEYAFPMATYDVIMQVGRFGRIDSFYNGVLDAPGNYQMSILPFAGYSYRMYNGSFTLMDGANLITRKKVDDILLTTRLSYGRAVLDNESLQREAFRKYDENLTFKSKDNNWDASLKFEYHNFSGYLSKNYYSSALTTSSGLLPYQYFTKKYKYAEYNLAKTGLEYDNQSYFARIETTAGKTYIYNSYGIESGEVKAFDYNIVLGKHIQEHKLYIGTSHGHNKTTNTINEDYFVGSTLNYKSLAFSTEYHIGRGQGWIEYDSANTKQKWNSFIFSTTYSF